MRRKHISTLMATALAAILTSGCAQKTARREPPIEATEQEQGQKEAFNIFIECLKIVMHAIP